MSFENTQITLASGYDVKNITYSKPRDGSIPNSSVTFKRVQIGTKNPDGSHGELILSTERLFSFGLSPNVNMTTGKTDGYTLALCLWNMDSPSKQEKEFTDTFNKICDHASDYILEHRDDVCKYELEKGDLKKFNPMYWKKEKGKIVEGTGPMLYAKVLQNKKNDLITSLFYDENGSDIEPMTLLNKQCYVKAAIKIEGIFIGSKVSLQVKLHEAEVKLKDSGVKRLLRSAPPQVEPQTFPQSELQLQKNDDDDDDSGSLKEEEQEDKEEQKEEVKKEEEKKVRTIRKQSKKT
jgi:hypothetical protein